MIRHLEAIRDERTEENEKNRKLAKRRGKGDRKGENTCLTHGKSEE